MRIPMRRKTMAACLAAALIFALGAAAHAYRIEARELARRLILWVSPAAVERVTSRQRTQDAQPFESGHDLETVLLPLKIKAIRVSDHYPLAKNKGAITAVGDSVVIVDRLGAFFSCSADGRVAMLKLPPLPNNVSGYLQAGFRLTTQTFVTYSMEYLSSKKILAVAHDRFHSQSGKTQLAVSTIGIDDRSLEATGPWRTIFASEDVAAEGSNDGMGGRLAVDGRQTLYLTTGEKIHRTPKGRSSSLGSIIAIDADTEKARTLSVGHRNAQGLTITKTGAILATEHGPVGGDELNLIVEGSNYGWPETTLGTEYAEFGWTQSETTGSHGKYAMPVFAWLPSIAVSNLIEVQGFSERWDGDLLVASLKGQSLFRLRLDGGRVLYSEPIWIGQRIRDITQIKDGTIVLWSDDTQLHFITVDAARLKANRRLSAGVSDELAVCMICHHVGATSPASTAPTLSGLFERRIASDTFRYTAALRSKDGMWTDELMEAFLDNPGAFASGTSMPRPNLSPEQLKRAVQALRAIPEQ